MLTTIYRKICQFALIAHRAEEIARVNSLADFRVSEIVQHLRRFHNMRIGIVNGAFPGVGHKSTSSNNAVLSFVYPRQISVRLCRYFDADCCSYKLVTAATSASLFQPCTRSRSALVSL